MAGNCHAKVRVRKMARKRRKRRVTQMRLMAGGLLVLMIAAVVLLGAFRIRAVEILGSERHSAEEIKSDLIYDFKTENTLYFAWKYRHAGADARAPYLDSIQVKLLSPGKVRLIVNEKKLYGYVQYAGNNVYFDSEGTVLEITGEQFEDVLLVTGVSMDEPVLYQKLPANNTAQLRTMLSITGLLSQAGLIPDSVAFDDNLNITLQIGDIDVKLGQDEYLEEKVANLVTIYQAIAGQSGTLNMEAFTGKSEPITLRPKEDSVQNAETDVKGDLPENTDETDAEGNPTEDGAAGDQAEDAAEETTGVSAFMVFDSSGTLRYDAHVVNGQVVDTYGNPIDGCTVEENGYVKDAYWNLIDPMTGQLAQ